MSQYSYVRGGGGDKENRHATGNTQPSSLSSQYTQNQSGGSQASQNPGRGGGSSLLRRLWYYYFPDVVLDSEESLPRQTIVEALHAFFVSQHQTFLKRQEIENLGRVAIDFVDLDKEIPIDEFQTALEEDPENVLACLELGAHLAAETLRYDLTKQKRLWVRLQHYPHIKPLRNLKAQFVEHFVAIKGTVVRVGVIKPLVQGMIFECATCKLRIFRNFPDGCYSPPTGCEGKCRGRHFVPQRRSASTDDWQQIRIQVRPILNVVWCLFVVM